jgi:hypothetical protein
MLRHPLSMAETFCLEFHHFDLQVKAGGAFLSVLSSYIDRYVDIQSINGGNFWFGLSSQSKESSCGCIKLLHSQEGRYSVKKT